MLLFVELAQLCASNYQDFAPVRCIVVAILLEQVAHIPRPSLDAISVILVRALVVAKANKLAA